MLEVEKRLEEHIRMYNIQDEGPVSKEEELEITKKMYALDMQAKDELHAKEMQAKDENTALKKALKSTKGFLRVSNKLATDLKDKVKGLQEQNDMILKEMKRNNFAKVTQLFARFNKLTADFKKDLEQHDKVMGKWRKFEEDERKAQQVAEQLGDMELA